MAEMIPDRLPSGASAGEKRVFEVLQRLPDHCIVYYEPVIENKYPDFVVIIPEMGLLIIEVKGWYPAHIESADSNNVKITNRGRVESQKHPIRQARDYMFALMDAAREFENCAPLLHHSGEYKGKFIFPFAHIVVMSNIRREQLDDLKLSPLFPADKVITRNEFEELASVEAGALPAALKKFVASWPAFKPLGEAQISVLRAVIHKDVLISRTVAPNGESTDTLKVLDLRQEGHARKIGEGHRILCGVAGSGKTLLLIARAKLLAEDPNKRVLVLCYNKSLAHYLQATFASHSSVVCMNFHAWGVRRNRVHFDSREDEEDFGQRLLARLERGEGDAVSFDAVLVDEGQDFPKTWFQCAKLALKEPEDGDLLVVCDGNQSVYQRRAFTWKDAGINAVGRTTTKKFDLDKNYRNHKQIIEIAAAFAAGDAEDKGEVTIARFKPDVASAVRSGPYPRLLAAGCRAEECDLAIEQIRDWLSSGLKPEEIGVLYRALRRKDKPAFADFVQKLKQMVPVYLATGPDGPEGEPQGALTLSTIFSSKGLQWRAVLILWADLLPFEGGKDQECLERGLMYVAMTRAEDELVLTRSGHSPFTEEIETALCRLQDERSSGRAGRS